MKQSRKFSLFVQRKSKLVLTLLIIVTLWSGLRHGFTANFRQTEFLLRDFFKAGLLYASIYGYYFDVIPAHAGISRGRQI